MIIQERIEIDGKEYIKSYSDRGMLIHGGSPEADYDEATDPTEFGRTYTETDIPIEGDTSAEEILNIILGGAE